MISQVARPQPLAPAAAPTLWGLNPLQLHDRYWAARGVAVIRQGQVSEIAPDAEQYLLIDSRDLAIFRLRGLVDLLSWVKPDVLYIRVRNLRDRQYRETVVTAPVAEAVTAGEALDGSADTLDRRAQAQGGTQVHAATLQARDDAAQDSPLDDGEPQELDDFPVVERFIRFKRIYGGADSRLARVALTRDPDVARLWQAAPDIHTAWKSVRRHVRHSRREVVTIKGRLYDSASPPELSQFVRDLIQYWRHPASTIPDIRRVGGQVWAHREAEVSSEATFIGPVWIGAGRVLNGPQTVLGPAALWDDPTVGAKASRLRWNEIEPAEQSAGLAAPAPVPLNRPNSFYQRSKRMFDIVFASIALLLTLPIYPIVMLAIWLEDGRPFFFGHRRETRGGRTFRCWKFRSMRKDADQIKAQLAAKNQADGPQFFIEHDPRLTRVGRIIRKLNIDELPQFVNVLLGHMSVVGPRPSPYSENQFCPPWREARLSVRPGITGLWQVMRTRKPGLDFQEWIRYDLEYVAKAGWRLDLYIILRTFIVLFRGAGS